MSDRSTIQSIALDGLIAHPDNPNRMSSGNFAKLVRNIEQTGRYEPLIVRPYREKPRHSRQGRAAPRHCERTKASVSGNDNENQESSIELRVSSIAAVSRLSTAIIAGRRCGSSVTSEPT